ncbi:hypothetical protein KSS87_002432 [Heliosperma pusillum]|nr:hypothetical protein KSS87_002432 [Heliosperma pusillum]
MFILRKITVFCCFLNLYLHQNYIIFILKSLIQVYYTTLSIKNYIV